MSGLHRRAVGGSKTTSKKAQSRASSAASSRINSRANSRVNSRNPSRANTDDEGDLSDDTNFRHGPRNVMRRSKLKLTRVSSRSYGSATPSELPSFDEVEEPGASWEDELRDVIVQISERDRKKSHDMREHAFIKYSKILAAVYANSNISSHTSEIIKSCLHSIKNGRTEKESLEALRALMLTTITDPDEGIFSWTANTLKRIITDDDRIRVKTRCIQAVANDAFFGGASTESTEDLMQFFMEIIESDGYSVGAADEGVVVTAAIEEWAFLASSLEDAEEISTEAMPAFVDQLQSSDVGVQVAAGEAIALCFEKSYTEAEEDEVDHPGQHKYIQRYDVYPRKDKLCETLKELSSGSKKYLSKRNKKSQKTAFKDILHSIEQPTLGPRYSEAENIDGKVMGSRMMIRVHRDGVMTVDKWWKLLRLQHNRRILGAGFFTHFSQNPAISESLE